jgi:putative CocE/NonD family hydrolase
VVYRLLAPARALTRLDFENLARAGLPALTSTGWDSYLVDAGSRAFTWLRAAGAGQRAKLVIGPCRHGAVFSGGPALGYEVAPGDQLRPYSGADVQLMWLDRWLRGDQNGIDTEPPVQIFVQGPDHWRYEHDWPLPDERRIRLYLSHIPSGTAASRNDGSLSTRLPSASGQASYDFDPATSRNPAAVTTPTMIFTGSGLPAIAPANLPPGASREHGRLIMDKTPYEADAATWTSSVLDHPTEITGFPRLVLWASVSRPEPDFIAELTDVGPDHTSTQITRGAAIDPSIEVSWHGPGLGAHPFTVTVYTGPDRASFAEIPVIGADPDL